MKLASYTRADGDSFGIVTDAGIIDLGARLGHEFPDLKHLLDGGLEAAAEIAASAEPDLPLDQVSLLPVVANPGAVWCAGINTHSHFEEAKDHMGATEKPAKPVLFLRTASTLVGSGSDLEKPALEPMFDYEGEIALVIGRRCRNVSVDDALDCVAGYSCFNDASARAYQISSSQITAGKNAYRSGGFGPWLVTTDEVDLASMRMSCRVNGATVQDMGLDDLIFSFAELIAFISEFTWLEPGDVVVTGSPEGVGVLRDPQILLSAGDKVEVEVTGVGTLVNTVRDQSKANQG
jgi:2-keto-4-pentenoate hydratase/2-oxohepta-3-ene-1,7-dioic acid hydratase in catechol pathway